MPETITPEVISLIRFSTQEQTALGKAGIEGQRRINEMAAKYHGVKIVNEYVVVDVSGRHTANDPQFTAMFNEMGKNPRIVGAVGNEQSRFARPEFFDDWHVVARFQRMRKMIFTPTGRIDPNTPEGRMALTMGGFMSGEELHNLKSRFARGKMIARMEGRSPGGNHMLPKGFRFIKERNDEGKVTGFHWEQDAVEMARMQKAFELLFANEPFEIIAGRIGGGWTGSGLKRAMQNPIWIGIRRYLYEASGEEFIPEPTAKHPNPKPRHKKVMRQVPFDVPTREELEAGAKPVVKPIMSIETWDAAQLNIAAREGIVRKTRAKNMDRPRFLGMGITFCICGEMMYPKYGSNRRSHLDAYGCKSRYHGGPGCGHPPIHREDFDLGLVQLISEKILNAEFLMKLLEAATAQDPVPDPVRVGIEKAQAGLEAGRKELRTLVRRGQMTAAEFIEDITALETELRQAEALMPPAPPPMDTKGFLQRIANTFASFARLPFTKKREILKGAVKAIVTDTKAGTITSIKISGGYLGSANGSLPSRTSLAIRAVPDLLIPFPEPYVIPSLYTDGRGTNGHHPNTVATQFKGRVQ